MRARRRPRVAVVGFQKTGTTSLKVALEYLGYEVARPEWPPTRAAIDGDLDRLRALAAGHEALQDVPWFLVFRELDGWFPGTKFVLTVRDEDSWMRSHRDHFGRPALVERYALSHRLVFGDVPPSDVDETPYRERYRAHNEAVVRYFADRPADLLVLELGKGGEWEQLCRHLGVEPPRARGRPVPFPRANPGSSHGDPSARARARRLRIARRFVAAALGQGVADHLGRQRRRLAVRLQRRRAPG